MNATLLTVAIIGLWAGAVYEPTAIIALAKKAGMAQPDAVKMASVGTAILSIGTILGCLCVPLLAERIGRRRTLGIYFAGMFIANVNAAVKGMTLRGKPVTALWLRTPMQILFIALLWWSTSPSHLWPPA